MRQSRYFLDGLVGLSATSDPADRRSAFRQSLASIGQALGAEGPSPLEDVSPDALASGVRIALADGLFEDHSWIADEIFAPAMFEVASFLPTGAERRELGRRVLSHLLDGRAATFVALATRMALQGSSRALSTPGVVARLTVCSHLPSSSDVPIGPLAWAIASRRELALEWIAKLSVGSLSARRLAARLFERAALEAVRRAHQGDDLALRPFRDIIAAELHGQRPSIAPRGTQLDPLAIAWSRLLADRESLVWQHVASARGLLATSVPELFDRIRSLLRPEHTATEWRRGATSLVASIALTPDPLLAETIALLRSPVVERDPGIATAMVWGLPRAAEIEPEAAEELLKALAVFSPVSIADSVVALRADVGADFGKTAAEACAKALSDSLRESQGDEGLAALARVVLRDLTDEMLGSALRRAVNGALETYVERGAADAAIAAGRAAVIATDLVESLEGIAGATEKELGISVGLVRDLDVNLRESSALRALALLDRKAEPQAAPHLAEVERRLLRWLLRRESSATAGASPAPHRLTAGQRQLRALLHLVDSDPGSDTGIDGAITAPLATEGVGVLVSRLLTEDRRSPLRRAIAAALARALDSLTRIDCLDPTDVLLATACSLPDPTDLAILAEASMHAGTVQLLSSYARFARNAPRTGRPSAAPGLSPILPQLERWVVEMPPGLSAKTEVLQGVLVRLCRALSAIERAQGARDLAQERTTDSAPLASLEEALRSLGQMTRAARLRTASPGAAAEAAPHERLTPALEHWIQAGQLAPLSRAIQETSEQVRRDLPSSIAEIVCSILPRIETLSMARKSERPRAMASEAALPAWLPARRTIGGFYVHRQLGGGAVGTVFLVTRTDERHDPNAERFALKVPDYNATAARRLSEAEFQALFREEAGALLGLPEDPHLSRFVTFDARAKPKPALVMELIEGLRCDKLISARALTTERAFRLLDGILAGLSVMHGAGVAHLDLKPTNIILRNENEPVLVDFGLSGRRIRPGCATGPYGAPEIWLQAEGGAQGSPLPADVYSFGCLAYEVLAGHPLFDGPSEVAIISEHLLHDGRPGKLADLDQDPALAPLVQILASCLRNDPATRIQIRELRTKLQPVAQALAKVPWPLGDHTAAPPSLVVPPLSITGFADEAPKA